MMVERALSEINRKDLTKRSFFKSPIAWEDQILYFLMLDRFSDGNEDGYRDVDGHLVQGETPLFREGDGENAVQSEEGAKRWRDAGGKWVGGTLKGLTSKIGYLQRLGVTAIWVSPIFKQVAFQSTYHGYGIQNFIDVDPHFGTREDLREIVRTAHEHGIYVIIDTILNHSGNVFQYPPEICQAFEDKGFFPWWSGNVYETLGFNDHLGNPVVPFEPVKPEDESNVWPHGAVWPKEFQERSNFTRKGAIRDWDYFPEYLEGDFFDLKDLTLGTGDVDRYEPRPALRSLIEVYKFWIAYADLDGFRVDTVKHMDPGAVRFFAAAIHEFAQSLGKETFYLIGEITGGREHAFHTLEITGIDAALGVDDIPEKLEGIVKGYRNPSEYFGLFRNSLLVDKDSHTWFNNKIVTMVDDHDQVWKGSYKARFSAGNNDQRQTLNALALNQTTMGIPCIYYGSEQCFDGQGGSDRYIREAMFGGEFGAFRSRGRHFFNEEGWVYQELAKIIAIRKEKLPLRRGRQYLRPISGDGVNFGLPQSLGGPIRSIIPWSRVFNDEEILVVFNSDHQSSHSAWVTIDNPIHETGKRIQCIYSSVEKNRVGDEVVVEERNGKSVWIALSPGEFAIYDCNAS